MPKSVVENLSFWPGGTVVVVGGVTLWHGCAGRGIEGWGRMPYQPIQEVVEAALGSRETCPPVPQGRITPRSLVRYPKIPKHDPKRW